MSKAVANTGKGTIAAVAMEQSFPPEQRILQDDLAYDILPGAMKIFVMMTRCSMFRDWVIRSGENIFPGVWAGILGRKCAIDDMVSESVSNMEAFVNIGAGFDTRAYRLPGLKNLKVWEVDFLENIKAKAKQLNRIFGSIPENTSLVSLDMLEASLEKDLEKYGFSFTMKTFFVMEGVTQYLTDESIEQIFGVLSKVPAGSRLALTYVLKDFVSGKELFGCQRGYEKYVKKEKIWSWGKNAADWPAFLKEYGWRIIEDIGGEQINERYIRRTGRALAVIPIERTLLAEKTS